MEPLEPKDKTFTINISQKTIFNIDILGLIVFALFKLQNIVFVVLTSVVLASFIRTAAEKVKIKLGLNRVLSVVLMYLLTLLVFAAVFYFFLPVLITEISNILPVIEQYLPVGTPFGETVATVGQNLETPDLVEGAKSILGILASGFGNTVSTLFGGVANVALVVIISFYMSVSRDGIESFLRIIAPIHKEAYVIDVWKRSQRKIALWLQGQMVLGVVVGLLTFLGLTLLGVRNAILLSVVAAVFELIPFGIFLAAVPAVTLAFAGGGLSLALMVLALYIIIQQLEGYLIAPLVVNKVTGVSPLIVILSVLIGLTLAGFWGLLLSVPVAVTVIEYINDLEKRRLLALQNE